MKKWNFIHWLWTWKNRFSRIYQWIKRRCENKNEKSYPRYWWRWIKIEWNSIKDFYDDMYESYKEHCEKYWEKNTTIDRINTNWNYSKENCRRATYKEQNNNRSDNSFVEVDWIKYGVQEFADKFSINYWTAKYRMRMYRSWKMSYESLTHIWKIY